MSRSHVHRLSSPLVAIVGALALVGAACADHADSANEGSLNTVSEIGPEVDEARVAATTVPSTTVADLEPSTNEQETSGVEADTTASESGAVPVATAPAGPDPEDEPTPDLDVVPADLVPIDVDGIDPGGIAPGPLTGLAFDHVASPQPSPVFQPTVAPAFAPVELDDESGLPGGGDGGLTFTAATGCGDHCIVDAVVTSAGGSSSRYDLSVDLENAATVEAYLSLAPIERNDLGGHVRPFSVPTASGAAGVFWTTTFDLDPSTEYHLLVRAIDEQGVSSVAGSFTTAEAMGPDKIVVPMPCADGCLEWVETELDPDGSGISITVTPDVDVALELAWSPDGFVQTDDGPTLDGPFTNTVQAVAGAMVSMGLSELTPATPYSFMITATDAMGGTDRMIASIATPSPTILAGIDRAHVHGDGDEGRLDRGEITFSMGTVGGATGYEFWDHRGEAKIASNTGVDLGRDSAGWLDADGAGEYPAIMLFGGERDGHNVMTCFVAADPDGDWRPEATITHCRGARTMWSMAYAAPMTLAEIRQLPDCGAFDVANPGADHCLRVATAPNADDQVSFDMVVWYDVG